MGDPKHGEAPYEQRQTPPHPHEPTMNDFMSHLGASLDERLGQGLRSYHRAKLSQLLDSTRWATYPLEERPSESSEN